MSGLGAVVRVVSAIPGSWRSSRATLCAQAVTRQVGSGPPRMRMAGLSRRGGAILGVVAGFSAWWRDSRLGGGIPGVVAGFSAWWRDSRRLESKAPAPGTPRKANQRRDHQNTPG